MKVETKVVYTLTEFEKNKLKNQRDSLSLIADNFCDGMKCDWMECASCPIDDMICKIRSVMGDIANLTRNS